MLSMRWKSEGLKILTAYYINKKESVDGNKNDKASTFEVILKLIQSSNYEMFHVVFDAMSDAEYMWQWSWERSTISLY